MDDNFKKYSRPLFIGTKFTVAQVNVKIEESLDKVKKTIIFYIYKNV